MQLQATLHFSLEGNGYGDAFVFGVWAFFAVDCRRVNAIPRRPLRIGDAVLGNQIRRGAAYASGGECVRRQLKTMTAVSDEWSAITGTTAGRPNETEPGDKQVNSASGTEQDP